MDVPIEPRGMVEVYIDDIIGLCVDINSSDNAAQLERAIVLAIQVTARPMHANKPSPREEMVALAKLLAKAGLEETKVILGWVFDFRCMLVLLPETKFVAWSEAISEIIQKSEAGTKELGRNLGRMTHLGMILPFVHHFLSRLRDRHERAKNCRKIKITTECTKDLNLMLFFLKKHEKASI